MGNDPRNPFQKLEALRGVLPAGPTPPPATDGKEHVVPTAIGWALRGRVVVRRERKGRGGKTVTVVRFPDAPLDDETADALARDLRRALGTGAVVEGATIVVQGDQVERVSSFLADAGARRIVRG